MQKEIYLAAGCFWGAEKYLDLIDGVLSTETGFANGNTPSPTYKEVYTDSTGYAETVRVVYDPSVLPLKELVRLYYKSIDPCSVNRQGEDSGTRYRTGIYFTDPADLADIEEVSSEVAASLDAPLAVERLPLKNFFKAEEYHQKYLEKHSDGYCHLPAALFDAVASGAGRKKLLYRDAERSLRSLLEGETDEVIIMAEVSAVIHEALGAWWTGFYRVQGDNLVLGPFQGPVACIRIPFGRGVCGTAWKEDRTVVVPDVHEFPGHIACSSLSRSEIVVPVRRSGSVVAVLDIDSRDLAAFDSTDALCLERIVSGLLD